MLSYVNVRYDKKLEAARKKFEDKLTQTRDGDCVLTPGEKGRDVVWVSWGVKSPPPKNFFPPPPQGFLGGGAKNFLGGAFALPKTPKRRPCHGPGRF